MPAVVIGAVSIWSGVGAMGAAAAWSGAAWAAGASIVGGAAMAFGGATGNKKLTNAGMVVAGLGGLATMAGNAGAFGANFAGNAGEVAAGSELLAGGTPAPGGSVINPPADVTVQSLSDTSGMSKEMLAMQKYQDTANSIMKTNMIAQTVGGVGQAYSGWAQGKAQKEAEDARLAEQKRLTERDYANRNNITGLKIPRIGIKPIGLINAQPR